VAVRPEESTKAEHPRRSFARHARQFARPPDPFEGHADRQFGIKERTRGAAPCIATMVAVASTTTIVDARTRTPLDRP
jgi:hypothetical protein